MLLHKNPPEVVKLEFSAQVVQQALSYTRFSHRVWVAVPVDTDSHSELRERNPALFVSTQSSVVWACWLAVGGKDEALKSSQFIGRLEIASTLWKRRSSSNDIEMSSKKAES
jgi:hypothetical protein